MKRASLKLGSAMGITLILWLFSTALCFSRTDEEQERALWLKNFKVHHLYTTDSQIILEIVNNNEPERAGPPGIGKTNFFLVAPTINSPRIKILDYDYSIFDKGEYIGKITSETKVGLFPPPDSQILNPANADNFRNFIVHRLDFTGAGTFLGAAGRSLQFVVNRVKCQLSFDRISQQLFDIKTIDPFGASVLKKIVVNPDDIERFGQADPEVGREFSGYRRFVERINSAFNKAPIVKVIVTRQGIQGINYDELKKSGIPVSELPIARLKLFYQNSEVPTVLRRGESKFDSFSEGDALYFYAPDPLSRKHDFDVYWLMVDDENSSPPLRMEVLSLPGEADMPVIETGWFEVKEYPPKNYHHFISFPLVFSHWYWDTIKQGEFREYTAYLYGVDKMAKECTFTLKIGTLERSKVNLCQVYINEKLLDRLEWFGWKTNVYTKTIPPLYLKEGANKITIEIPEIREKERYSTELHLFGLEFKYQGELQTEEDCMIFTTSASADKVASQFKFKIPVGNSPIYVFNVTDYAKPYLLVNLPIGVDSKRFFIDKVERENKYCIVTSKGANIPRLKLLTKPLVLLDESHTADYLIITHPRFTPHLGALIYERKKDGVRVFVAEIDDVYDNFSYGCKESFAIKNFIKYVYYHWQPPRISDVLLVGEASDVHGDPTQYSTDVQEDLIPVYCHEYPETFARADNQYTVISGRMIPDVAIGRFSVNNVEELRSCIEKTLSYSSEQNNFGFWRQRFLFITDDEAEFPQIAEYLIKIGLPEAFTPVRLYQRDFDYTNFYRVFQRKKTPQATQAMIDELNQGTVIYNFFGHGGPNIWTAERLFHVFEDLQHFNNAKRLSFLTSSSCDTAWLDYPTSPVSSSMGELLLKTPQKGCIGIFAPTTGATPTDHKFLMRSFFNAIFNFNFRRFGEVILATKLTYALEQSNPAVLDQFVLLGDPYLSFNFDIPELKDIQLSSAFVNTKAGEKIKLLGILPTPTWGWAEVSLISVKKRLNQKIAEFLPVSAGVIEEEVNIPPLEPGKYILQIYAYNALKRREYIKNMPMEAIDPRLELTLSYDAPTTFPLPGAEFTINVLLKNPTKLFLPEVDVHIAYGEEERTILEKKVNLPPESQWTPQIKLQIAQPDIYRILARAKLREKEDTPPYYTIEKELFVPVFSQTERPALALNPREIQVQPNLLNRHSKIKFTIPVYNLTDTPKENVICGLWRDKDQTLLENTLVGTIAGWGKKTITLNAEKSLPPGENTIYIALYQSEKIPEKPENLPADAFVVRHELKVYEDADLIVVPDSIKFRSVNFLNGETIHIDSQIKNIGESAAKDIEVSAYVNRPLMTVNLITPFFGDSPIKRIDELKPGEEKSVSFRWDRFGTPGTYPIFVVVNPEKKLTEINYNNNTASSKVTIHPEGNLKIENKDITLSRNYARRGDKIDVAFTIHNAGSFDYNNFQVLCRQRGKNKDPIPIGEHLVVDLLPANSSLTRAIVWEVAEGYNEVEINVNPRETLNEANYADNKAYAQVEYIVPIFALTPKGQEKEPGMKEPLKLGQFDLTNLNAAYSITNTEFIDAQGIRAPLQPIYIVNREVLNEQPAGKDVDRDNRWLSREMLYGIKLDGWLEASPWEDPEPITISIPVPDKTTTYYDVYIVVQTNKDIRGYPASKFKLQIEKEPQFKVCDYTEQKAPWATISYYLGRYNLYDGFLDLTIDNVSGSFWTIVNRIDFVPLKGSYTSPIFDLTEKWKKRKDLLFRFLPASPAEYTHIEYLYRFSKKDSLEAWNEWQSLSLDDNGSSNMLPVQGRYLQWKSILYSDISQSPQINNVWLEFAR